MDKWAPLEPSRPGASGGKAAAGTAPATSNGRFSLNTALSSVTGGARNAYSQASSGGVDGLLRRKSSAGASPFKPGGRYDDGGGRTAPSGATTTVSDAFPIGQLPSSVALRILQYVPLPTLLSCRLVSRNLARVVADEAIWRWRLEALGWRDVEGLDEPEEVHAIQGEQASEDRERAAKEKEAEELAAAAAAKKAAAPAAAADDDFGEFADARTPSAEPVTPGGTDFGEFFAAPTPIKPGQAVAGHGGSLANGFASIAIGPRPSAQAVFSYQAEARLPDPNEHRSYRLLRARARQLKPYLDSFSLKANATSSLLFTEPSLGLASQAAMLVNLVRFIAAPCLGVSLERAHRLWPKVVEAATYLHGILLPAFEGAEARRADAVRAGRLSGTENTKRAVERAENDMRQHASGIWHLGTALALGNPQAQSDALVARLKQQQDAEPPGSATRDMFVIDSGPDGQQTVGGSLGKADDAADGMAISAAQAFLERRDVLDRSGAHDPLQNIGPQGALDFTPMDTLVNEVLDTLRTDGCLIARVFPPEQDVVLAFADRVAGEIVSDYVGPLLVAALNTSKETYVRASAATFAQVLRMVEALQDVEPKSAQLSRDRCEDVIYRAWEPNMDQYLRVEQEWVGQTLREVCDSWHRSVENDNAATKVDAAFLASHNPAAVKRNFLTGFKDVLLAPVVVVPRAAVYVGGAAIRTVGTGVAQLNPLRWQSKGTPETSRPATPLPEDRAAPPSTPVSSGPSRQRFSRLQLLLSLDTALQLIQINRDALRRIETFRKYPGEYGHRVAAEINDVATAIFTFLGEQHVTPGLQKAKAQIEQWRPDEHEQDAESHVAPLVHFFELTHVADTIQQMLQVYYDEEIARYIDKTDFLNPVVRGKKRFEAALDDGVAEGLNAGVDLLMGQAEHIISSQQHPRDYAPLPNADVDLGSPTQACAECIRCLGVHCRMLVGSTDKNVLEVFYQEVGLRLYTLITKHLKRQIITLDGGFKVIADINAYHAFAQGVLKQPNVTVLFEGLKMLGSLYIIDSPSELGTIVRDADMFPGTLGPEDLYDFLRARADFRQIEAAVDQELYGFKLKEDCTVM